MSAPFADDALAELAGSAGPLTAIDVTQMRAAIAERAADRQRGPAQHEVADLVVAGCPARLFRPASGPLPVLLQLHGGGWTIGDLVSFDRVCRRLAVASSCAVLALEYRLAPEHPWPAAVDDAVAALRWLAAAPDELGERPAAVGVLGDSSGGTLAALACLRLRDEEPAALPALGVLVYPNLDLTMAVEREAGPGREVPGGGVDLETEAFFVEQWVPDPARRGDGDVSPLHAADLSGLPPTLLVSAALDPLRHEAALYAERLRAAGSEVEAVVEDGLIHNFLQYDEASPACAQAADRLAAAAGERLRA